MHRLLFLLLLTVVFTFQSRAIASDCLPAGSANNNRGDISRAGRSVPGQLACNDQYQRRTWRAIRTPPITGSNSRNTTTNNHTRPAAYTLSHQYEDVRQRILKEANQAVHSNLTSLNHRSTALERQLERDFADLRCRMLARRNTICNPNCNSQILAQRRHAELRRHRWQTEFTARRSHIMNEARDRADRLRVTAANLLDQMRSTHGTIGLVPEGTNLYVRSYIHFPDSGQPAYTSPPLVPLKANPAKLLNSVHPPQRPELDPPQEN